jgi:hypothetical protein
MTFYPAKAGDASSLEIGLKLFARSALVRPAREGPFYLTVESPGVYLTATGRSLTIAMPQIRILLSGRSPHGAAESILTLVLPRRRSPDYIEPELPGGTPGFEDECRWAFLESSWFGAGFALEGRLRSPSHSTRQSVWLATTPELLRIINADVRGNSLEHMASPMQRSQRY